MITSPSDKQSYQYVQVQQMDQHNSYKTSEYHAVKDSWSTTRPCPQLHIQYPYILHWPTSSSTPVPAANDATPNLKFPTRIALSLAKPVLDAYHLNGQQAFVTFTHR